MRSHNRSGWPATNPFSTSTSLQTRLVMSNPTARHPLDILALDLLGCVTNTDDDDRHAARVGLASTELEGAPSHPALIPHRRRCGYACRSWPRCDLPSRLAPSLRPAWTRRTRPRGARLATARSDRGAPGARPLHPRRFKPGPIQHKYVAVFDDSA
jgi:hypothetical protein